MHLTGPKGRPITGNLAEFRADRLAFFTRCAREYGDIVPIRLARYRCILLSRPDLVEQVLVQPPTAPFIKHFGLRLYKPVLGHGLVTSEGDFWRRQRKLSAPAFQGNRLAAYAQAMVDSTVRMVREWGRIEDGGWRMEDSGKAPAQSSILHPLSSPAEGTRDIHADLMHLTLDIACRTLFGADACPDPRIVGQALEDGMHSIAKRWGSMIPLPGWLPTPNNRRLTRSVRALDDVVRGIITRRRSARAAGAPAGDDLLSMLLAATDEEGDGSGMSDQQLLDEARTILLAGHETTALALTYSLYLLAQHPMAQARLQQELTDVLCDRPPAYADLPRLRFARNVVTESMRLYPPADFLGREATADCTLAGIPVRRGTNLFVSQWVMHHDARWFPRPDEFDPDRWTPEFEKSLPRFAYFPFGAGPRYCIGQTFATTEAILVLATICQRFTFAPDPTYRLELWPNITLRPKTGVRLRVEAREAAPAFAPSLT